MYRFLIIVEPTETGFSAYSPDLPGCIATGSTRDEVEKNMYEAIEFHVEGMVEEGYSIPHSQASSEYVLMRGPETQVA